MGAGATGCFRVPVACASALCGLAHVAVAQPAPELVRRADWQARPALTSIEMSPQEVRYITIHHSGVAQNRKRNLEYKMRSLQAFSQKKTKLASGKPKPAWADVPYHYYIALTGRTAEGRDVRYAGDTNTNYSPLGHIQIVLEGNFQKEKPSPEQLDAMRKLTRWLAAKWKIAPDHIQGHAHHASTTCPGKHLLPHVSALRAKLR